MIHRSALPLSGFAFLLILQGLIADVMESLPARSQARSVESSPAWPEWKDMPRIRTVTAVQDPDYPGFPSPLQWFNFSSGTVHGDPVKNSVEWYNGRRKEIIRMLEHYMYGTSPAAPENPIYSVTEVRPDFLGGWVTREKFLMDFGIPGIPAKTGYLYLPNKFEGPLPVIASLAKTDNPGDWEPGGSRADRWHMEQTFSRGYALAIVSVDQFAADIHDRTLWRNALVAPFAQAGFEGDWQIIAAWAWGLSRVIDFLDTHPEIDPDKTIITGFSRRGKACPRSTGGACGPPPDRLRWPRT